MTIRNPGLLVMGVVVLVLALGIGCSSGDGLGPILPVSPARDGGSSETHILWGMYQFICKPEIEAIEVIPLRGLDMHLNVLVFLEPPPLVNLTLESLKFNGNIIEADIGLRHPFLGLTEFTGFDVSGILISKGSYQGFSDTGICIAVPGDLRLLNADGHSRWWNPTEFPANPSAPAFGYKDGLLGTPDSAGDYNATVNGYKYFAEGLGANDDVSTINPSKRGLFAAGQKNIRHYTIDMGTAGLIFNYAVDACWLFPQGDPPWVAPDDFSPDANRKEPYFISITETQNTMWHDGTSFGGALSLDINIYDWYNIDQDWVRVESPGAFTAVEQTIPTGGGANYSTYHIDITDVTLSSSDDLTLLVSAFCEDEGFQDFLPGKTTAAYKLHYSNVATEPPGPPPTAVADSIPKIGFINFPGDFYGNNSTGIITLYEWDFEGDGKYDWSSPITGNTTHAYTAEGNYNATLKVSNAGGFTTAIVPIRMIDPLPIIKNGNFWYGNYDYWTISQGGVGNLSYQLIDDPTFKRYLKILRVNAGSDGGSTRFVQTLDADVSGYTHLYFNAFFKIVTQTLNGDGWWGQYGGIGEFPFFVFVYYLNKNDEQRFFCYGYLKDDAAAVYNYVWEWDTASFASYHPGCAHYKYEKNLPLNVWHERKTIDLMTLGTDSPKTLQYIQIWTAGWNYEAHWILPWFSDH